VHFEKLTPCQPHHLTQRGQVHRLPRFIEGKRLTERIDNPRLSRHDCEKYAETIGKEIGTSLKIERVQTWKAIKYNLWMNDTILKQSEVSLREVLEFLTGFESAINWIQHTIGFKEGKRHNSNHHQWR